MRIHEALTRLEPVHALLMRLDAQKRNELGATAAKLGDLPSEGIQIEHTEKTFEAFRTVYEYARDHGPNSLVSIDSLQQLLQDSKKRGDVVSEVTEQKLEPRTARFTARDALLLIIALLLLARLFIG